MIFILLTLAFVNSLWAQTQTAELIGSITDSSGAATPAATILVVSAKTGVSRSAQSNEQGQYRITNLLPGIYNVTVTKVGFQSMTTSNLVLDVGQIGNAPFRLQPGQVSEQVEVTAEAAGIETATAQLGTVVSEEKIAELPLNGRNFTQLLTLTPGAAPVSVAQNGTGNSMTQRIGITVFPAFNGQSNRSNQFTLDGVYNTDHFQQTYAIAPSVDGINQFRVEANGDQAEFGGVSGGTVNIATKSGTNQLHGSLYEFLRNDALDARGFFAANRAPLRQNQFGGTVGGPVRKDRSFFFFSYEGYRQQRRSDSLSLVPTLAQREGDFSALARPLYNPFSTRADASQPSGFSRDVYPGNRIPASQFNRSTLAWMNAVIPRPVETGVSAFNSRNTTPQTAPANQYNVRGDHQFSSNDFVWARYTWAHQDQTGPLGVQGTTLTTSIPAKNFGANYTHVQGANGVFNVLFGYSSLGLSDRRFLTDQKLIAEGYFKGLPLLDDINAPGMTVSSVFGGLAANNRILGPAKGIQGLANYSRVSGRHTWKVGAAGIHQPWRNTQVSPVFTFNALQTANPNSTGSSGFDLASFLLGVPDAVQLTNSDLRLYSRLWSAYIQDSWKVNSRLTLNFGLRWDLQETPTVTNGLPSTWDFTAGRYIVGGNPPPVCSSTQASPCLVDPNNEYNRQYVVYTGSPKLRSNDYKMFGPRVGIAYRVRQNTVVRASFGIVYDLLAGISQQGQNVANAWPASGATTLQNLNRPGVQILVDDPFQGRDPRVPAATPASQAGFLVDPRFQSPYSNQWTVEVQHELNAGTVLSAAYVGSHSVRLPVGGAYNTALTPGPGAVAPRALFPFAPVSNYDRSIGQSSYNALQLKAQRRLAGGLSYLVAYTRSKAIDVASSGQFGAEGFSLQNPYDPNSSRSVSAFDLPTVFSVAALYTIPFGKGHALAHSGLLSRVVGGWQVNAIVGARSGQPFTPVTNLDIANIGATSTRPNLIGDPKVSAATPQAWFNTKAFAAPATYTFGNAGRNILRSDSFRNLDLSLFRQDRITERIHTQFRVEAFNVTNSTAFGVPNAIITSAAFGTIGSTVSSARQVQLGLKVIF